jgi:uncharacterized membrane protein (UPF0182 family)
VLVVLRSVRLIVLAAAALLFFGLPSVVRAYTDWLWFHEVQFPSIFTTMWTTRLGLGTIVFLAVWGWLFLNLRVALQTLRSTAPFVWTGQQGVQLALPGRRQLQRLALIATAVVSVPIALIASGQWLLWLAFRHAVPFGTADPILGHDIAFYIFTLPVLELANNGIQALVVLAALGSGAAYVLAGALGLAPTGGLIVSRSAQRHLALLVALFFLTLAVGAWLDRPRALLSDAGIVYGASYTDVNARFPVAAIRIVVALAGAAVAVVASVRRFGLVFLAAGVYFAIVLGGGAYAAAIQRFVVAPNEQTREAPYIGHHIAATRFAFGLHNVDDRELSGDARLTAEDIARNGATFRNVRLWDHQPLLDTFGQLQEIRPYYDFHSVDNDRYTINGEYRQVMLSARELNSDALQNRSWINEHLTFTHGYGLTLGPVNQVTEEGLPVLFVRDLPPVSTVDLPIKEPSVYFGELSNDYVLVRSQAKEFHYPSGEDNVTTQYTGRAGVPIGSFWRRALFAMRFRAQQIVFSSDVTSDTRILFHRRVDERVRRIAPFLWYDDDPYLVVHNGRLVWIQDAYTFSRNYPYSRPSEEFGVSYVRNSVKVTIDAYDGSVLFYLADPSDPVAATYSRVFPDLFRPLSAMPASLRQHLRYPEQLFQVQTAMYTTFHMTNPVVFYNKEDQWEIPVIDRQDGQAEQMQPYYTIMKLPGETGSEFIQMVPLTPRRKDNLAAWMVARSDAQHYGRLMVFRFPKQKVVFGPRQVVARINQDQVISPQITLWNQQGSQVVQGTLLVVPVEESLVYIRPLYLRAQGGKIPELKRVIVAYQNTIVMEPTLEAGLDRIFGQQATAQFRADTERLAVERGDVPVSAPGQKPAGPAPQAPQTLQALAAQARDHYQRAIQAQKAGNWAQYGQEIEALGRVIEQMRAQGAK